MPKLDREMLEWTGDGDEARLMSSCSTTMPSARRLRPRKNGLPDTKVGTFSRGLMDEAKKTGWTVTA